MSFPPSPYTGQTAIINNITYSYSTSTQAWTRVAGYVTSTTYLSIVNNTPSSSTTTGALTVVGGVGIGSDLWVGGDINVSGNVNFTGIGVDTISSTTGTFVNVAITGTGIALVVSDSASINGTAGTNSTASGALQVKGGVGIGGGLYVGGAVTATIFVGTATQANNLNGGAAGSLPYQSSTGTTTFLNIMPSGFVLTSSGTAPQWTPLSGVSAGTATTASNIAGGLVNQIPYQSGPGATIFDSGLTYNGTTLATGNISVTANTNATSTTTGALQVAGGAGFGGNVFIGGSAYLSGDLYVDGTSFTVSSNNINTGDKTLTLSTGSSNAALAANSGLQIGTTSTPYATWLYDGSAYWVSAGSNGGGIKASSTASVVSTTTGALVVTGGVGIGGGLIVGSVVTATNINAVLGTASAQGNIYGGAAGSLVYQTGLSTTGFLAGGSAGTTLRYFGAAPIWSSTATFSGGTASTATVSAQSETITGGGLGVVGDSYFQNAVNVGGTMYAGNFASTGTIVAGGVRSTTSATPPANPTVGDIWYATGTDDVYRYTADGANSFWLDMNGPAIANATAGVILLSTLKTVVANSADFNAFKAAIAAL